MDKDIDLKRKRQLDITSGPTSIDLTPTNFSIKRDSLKERFIKSPFRCLVYPVWIKFSTIFLKRRFHFLRKVPAVKLLDGERGNDYYNNRKLLNRFHKIQSADVFIQGCGMGKDVLSWVAWNPRSLTCLDYFCYRRAWDMLEQEIKLRSNGQIKVQFMQMDISDISIFQNKKFDIIASDAVYEHVRNLKSALCESYRVLRPGGYLYAAFGPLWYCFGGDHISGREDLSEGYNHLLLNKDEYKAYLRSFPMENENNIDDGQQLWIKEDLFGRLRLDEYLMLFEDYFIVKYCDVIVSPEALKFRNQFPQIWKILTKDKGINECDLVIKAVRVILEKSGGKDDSGYKNIG